MASGPGALELCTRPGRLLIVAASVDVAEREALPDSP